jgi:hypothetical protein
MRHIAAVRFSQKNAATMRFEAQGKPALPKTKHDNGWHCADVGRSVLRPYMFVGESWDSMRLTVGVGATRIGEYPSE